ncbi:copper resistance protein B [Sphingomonas solaris]|uniref:Copper resistance protein CopB n=1 Tax=Alterirhizorhabdus solaris TaxID=2529389 RepID=A0A558RAB2_9SPHN|nr:copper resistance protein B [Sphingomonas solaris]TVV76311.1 copper resistance protein CopB [Sphingomonas solaris]
MKALFLLAAAPLALASPALAQHAGHVAPSKADAGHDMAGMDMVGAPAPEAGPAMPGTKQEGDGPPTPADPHAGHDMSGMTTDGAASAADPHAGHDMAGMKMDGAEPPAGAATSDGMAGMDHAAMGHGAAPAAGEVGDASAPPPPADRWADRYYPRAEMDAARAITRAEHGGGQYSQIMFNLAEVQVREGREGYRWDGEGWFGGDIDRLTIKTEGEASFGRTPGSNVEAAEAQALWSHAIDPYWNLQSGVRVDVQPGPSRAYATLGFEGLAPYWFEVEGAVFLSDRGDVLARLEAYYDQRLTQRLVLQPRAELNFAAQDVPENEMGSGLVNAELGLRLRYEITREFAPYVGVSWDRKAGDTARYARANGERASEASFVAGVRFWF